MDAFSFTTDKLNQIKCPAGKARIRVQDVKIPGLSFRVNAGGSKVYCYYRRLPDDNENPRKICEVTLGIFGEITLDEARTRAQELNVQVGTGRDPSAKSVNETMTYDSLFQRWIDEYAKARTSSWKDAVYNHGRYCTRWHKTPLAKITREKVQHWVNDTGKEFGKATANRTYNTVRAVFSWALRKDIITGNNPCAGVDTFRLQSRERFILPGNEFEEFAKALNAEPNETIRDFFWMCLYTGARRSNVLAMEWAQIDFKLLMWRIPKTKNQDSLTVPLTAAAMEILNRRHTSENAHEQWVFPSDRIGKKTRVLGHMVSPHKAWGRIIKRTEGKIENLRIHDLRRTAGSYMAIEGISPTIIGKALGHKSPHSTAIYTRLTQDPVRAALEKAHQALIGSATKPEPEQKHVRDKTARSAKPKRKSAARSSKSAAGKTKSRRSKK